MTLHPHQPPSLCAADAKAQAAIERLKTPRDIKRYLRARQGYEAALEACEQIWPAWSANGCRKLDLRVSRWKYYENQGRISTFEVCSCGMCVSCLCWATKTKNKIVF